MGTWSFKHAYMMPASYHTRGSYGYDSQFEFNIILPLYSLYYYYFVLHLLLWVHILSLWIFFTLQRRSIVSKLKKPAVTSFQPSPYLKLSTIMYPTHHLADIPIASLHDLYEWGSDTQGIIILTLLKNNSDTSRNNSTLPDTILRYQKQFLHFQQQLWQLWHF